MQNHGPFAHPVQPRRRVARTSTAMMLITALMVAAAGGIGAHVVHKTWLEMNHTRLDPAHFCGAC